uniref:Uncharacterized protein n=1 Tax=Arundo donax TaxID=35708 RepID=A0A0A9FKN3_ARUDO
MDSPCDHILSRISQLMLCAYTIQYSFPELYDMDVILNRI